MKKSQSAGPPRWADRLLETVCAPYLLEEVQGDLHERFRRNTARIGERAARRQFVWEVLSFLRPVFLKRQRDDHPKPLFTDMLRNYFTVAFRTLAQQKSYAIINITGLALGLAACILIFLVVRNELTYDDFHAKPAQTYRVTVHGLDYNPSVSFAVAPALRNDFPELEAVSQYFYSPQGLVQVGNTRYNEEGFAFADGDFSKVFHFDWLAGDPRTALREPNTVVLTERMAHKYFGDDPALDRTIRLDNRADLRVTGVIKDLPPNTHLSFLFLVSWETIRKEVNLSNFWSIQGGMLYAVLPEKRSVKGVEAQLPAFIRKNWGEDVAKGATLLLQPLREIHFDQRYLTQVVMPRPKGTIYGLAVVAIFIILSACINFINLATAQAVKRSKEVGIRKTLGAHQGQLIGQALGETTVLVGLAVILALAGVWAFMPLTEPLLNIRIEPRQLAEPQVIGIIVSITLLTILLAGLYPAFVQSSFQPIKALRARRAGASIGGITVRKGLVTLQFAISQILIIGTLVLASQMDFFLNQNMGFDKELVISFPVGNKDKRDVLRQQLADNPGVEEVSFASASPVHNVNFAPFSSPELSMTDEDVTEVKFVDENYLAMYHLDLLAGEPVRKLTAGDTIKPLIVNQTLMKRLGIQDPARAIGKRVNLAGPSIIRGVVRDFQSESKHKAIRACVLLYNPNAFWQVSAKLRPHRLRETLASIDKDWSALNPDDLFQYEFLDQHIAKLYTQEEKMYNACRLFAGIALLIGGLGLYGLVSLMTVQRMKEVGIRKVLGASVGSIVGLFSQEFVWLMLIAFGLAVPVAWYAMNSWLREFAYHIQIGPSIFLISVLATSAIVAFTVSFQSIKTALINPVKSLRSE